MTEKDRMIDFIVNSKGHCFFCLNKISPKLAPALGKVEGSQNESSSTTSSLQTLQCLSQYLEMDIAKVFQEKGSIPPSLLAKVEQSKLKVELCGGCSRLTNSFSVLYRQLEKLKFEMNSNLSQVQEKMLSAEVLGRTAELRGLDRSGKDEGLLEVLQTLRTEAIEKCSIRTANYVPRLKIQNLTRREDHLRTRNAVSEAAAESLLHFNNEIKLENQQETSICSDDDYRDEVFDKLDNNDTNHSDCGGSESRNESIQTKSATYASENADVKGSKNER